ncbi:VOC family protein [Haloprofundus halophilus]|uniref:VOC family protein n=1 Tax=Haloprofundus halophilus TaxID=2283527 RepID=UPI000E44996D|nr:VOC family protein [Haloprofundus halophilus]
MRLTLDHVPFAGTDLDSLVAAFDSVGLTPEYGGVHGTGTTHMSVLGFDDDSYLELISTTPGTSAEAAGFWPEYIAADGGPTAWCIEVENPATEAKRLIDAGASVDGPKTASRERDDGTVVEWDMLFAGDGRERELLPFAIADRTPKSRRVTPTPSVADGPLTGVAAVVLGVHDVGEASELFRQLYRFPSAEPLDGSPREWSLSRVPGQPVFFAEPSGETSSLARRLAELGPGPCAYLLGTESLEEAAATYALTDSENWGDSSVAWFDAPRLDGSVGVID